MKSPIISRPSRSAEIGRKSLRLHDHRSERGVTLLLVALAMVAIIAMAALAIDVVTLYLAREEAQRAADTGAIAGARILSLTGVTGDPDNNNVSGTAIVPWPAACTLAQQVAQTVAQQNSVNSQQPNLPTVTFLYNGTAISDCSISGGTAFGMNPQVQVQVVQSGLPSLFSRIWSRAASSISATATAEAYNAANSATYTSGGDIVPVAPRCVKPWVIPNLDPQGAGPIVNPTTGQISKPGIMVSTSPLDSGIIGQTLTLSDACGASTDCTALSGGSTIIAKNTYVPALISTSALPIAVPSCANGDNFQEAVGGCDVATTYSCGTLNGAQLNYAINPYNDTDTAVNCLITSGPDTIDATGFPFQIKAGPSNPYASVGQPVSSSASIVTLPIYNSTANWPPAGNNQPQVTIIGFLQVFLTGPSSGGTMNAFVLNATGCGNGINATSNPVFGSSPVPIRLITPP